MKRICKLCLLAAAMVILLNGCAGNAGGEKEDSTPQEEIEEVPSEEEKLITPVVFEGIDIEGNAVSDSVFSESELTMVNVWATYCNPCLREMPGLSELAGEYEPGQFQIIGIISDVPEGADEETMELAVGLIEQTGAGYTHLLLNESLYYALLTDVTAVPTTFFVDENGVVLKTVVGSMEKSAWEEIVNELLEK